LARLYGPRLQQLSEEFSSHGVQVVGVNSNPQDSPDDIKRFAKEHGVSFPVIKDHRQSLAKKFGAKRTPEVFVLDASGHVRYQGRIDDQYEPGTARPKPSRHDLRNALESLIAGRDGCRCGRKHRRSRLPVQPGDEENAARHHRPL
jgi:peroxiredoxin